VNNEIINALDQLLESHFGRDNALVNGGLTVQDICERLHLSQRYLSDMLKSLTGLNTQQYIQHAMIEKAKQKLSGTDLSVSEIAYGLGFEHPQSFSKLFKSKTNLSPLEFRASFN
jgi:AraC-like DNA-binding protein